MDEIKIAKNKLSAFEDLAMQITEDLKKVSNLTEDIDVEYFQRYKPERGENDRAYIAARYEDFGVKIQIVADYLCKLTSNAKALETLLFRLEEQRK